MAEPTRRAPRLLWFTGFLAIVFAIYAPVIGGKPFVDDWVYVFENPAPHITGAFNQLHPYVFYRPLALAITASLQMMGGGSPVPIHVLQFVIHALLALVVASMATRLGASRQAAALAGVFAAVAQVAAGTVGSYDTLSLALSTLLGTASAGCMLGAPRRPVLAVSLFAVALLNKESALGYMPLLVLLAIRPVGDGSVAREPASLRRALPMIAALVAITLVYAAWRTHLGGFAPTAGSDRYNMSFGPGVVRNLVMLWFAALIPLSTVDVFTSVMQRNMPVILLGVVSACVVLVLAVGGFAATRRWKPVVIAVLAASIAIAPVLPLNHVSEVYAYTLLPFLALLFGESVVRLTAMRRLVRPAAVAAAGAVLVLNTAAARQKAIDMEKSGRRAERMLQELVAEISTMPAGATLVLRQREFKPPDYSIFRVRSFLLVPNETLLERSGRRDVTLLRIAEGDSVLVTGSYGRQIALDDEGRLNKLFDR